MKKLDFDLMTLDGMVYVVSKNNSLIYYSRLLTNYSSRVYRVVCKYCKTCTDYITVTFVPGMDWRFVKPLAMILATLILFGSFATVSNSTPTDWFTGVDDCGDEYTENILVMVIASLLLGWSVTALVVQALYLTVWSTIAVSAVFLVCMLTLHYYQTLFWYGSQTPVSSSGTPVPVN